MEFLVGKTSHCQLWNTLVSFTVVVVVLNMSSSPADGSGDDFKIETDPLVKLQNGTMGMLPCTVTGKPLAVQWSRIQTNERPVLVFIDFTVVSTDERGGPGYDEGLYNITDDFSLVIHEVNFKDEGEYLCEVVDQTGKTYNAQTILKIYALPSEPFPTIENCHSNSSTQNRGQNCTLYDTKPSHNVSCLVDGYTPDVNISIYFRHKADKLDVIETLEWQNDDRTRGMSVIISANASFYSYECVIWIVLKKDEKIQRVAAVTVRQRPALSSDEHDQHKEVLVISVLFYISCLSPLIVILAMMPDGKFDVSKYFTLLLVSSVPCAMVTIGGMYKDNCPVENLIPIYLIVMGSASLLAFIISLLSSWTDKMIMDKSTRELIDWVLLLVLIFILFFILVFFIVGNVWIYRIVWPNTTDQSSPEYCHPNLYLFSFWLTTSTYILTFLVLIRFLIDVFISCCCRKRGNET